MVPRSWLCNWRGTTARLMAADEHPAFAADRDGPHGSFGRVVGNR
ncbi:MAG: hypothetical protein R3C20_06435 [Planctomycetaceae bacterium]